MDDNGPSRLVWLARQHIFALVHEGRPRGFGDLMNWSTNTSSGCQNSITNASLSARSKPEEILNPASRWNSSARRDGGEENFCGEMPLWQIFFLSEWTDRPPVRTSSYLKGMHWRDLRGEKVTQVTGEAKCLDCVRGPLAMRRSFTLPCLSSSQLRWMRPAGTAPLSDNCGSGLCPGVPPLPPTQGSRPD